MERQYKHLREQLEVDTMPQPSECAPFSDPTSSDQSETDTQETELRVILSGDGMEAYLTLQANPPEPFPFTYEMVEQALLEQGVVEGILLDEIQEVLYHQVYVIEHLVAKGIKQIEGEDARIEYLFDLAPKLYSAATDDKIDWRETNLIQKVVENQLVARKTPSKPGIPGITVTGKVVEPYTARDVQLRGGHGTKINDSDPDELLAAVPGAVRLDSNRVIVDPVLHVLNNVDFSIGNIDFQGSVQIGGNILPGFQVRATGDVHIDGYVEGALVEAGGNVWIAGGIMGKADDTVVHAGKDVSAKFARGASVTAGGNISIRVEAVLCNMHSGATISVGTPERRLGRIVGGQVEATLAIHAVHIGSESESATTIAVLPKEVVSEKESGLKERAETLSQNHTAIMAEIAKLMVRKRMDLANWTPAREQLLLQLTEAANHLERELYSIDPKRAEKPPAENQPEKSELTGPPRVVVGGSLYPGVHVTIGRATRKFLVKLDHMQLVTTDDGRSIVSIAI